MHSPRPRRAAPTLLAALLTGAAVWPACVVPVAGQEEPSGHTDPWAGSSVPYVHQGAGDRLLCGGAAAAMVLRVHGVRGVYADDFASLVRPDEGGIRTGDLARAVEGRGMQLVSGSAPPDATPGELLRRGPFIVLLEDGTDRYHYVVVVAVGPDHVRVHDPASGPDRRVLREAFLTRWEDADRWFLQPLPGPFPQALPGPPGPRSGPPDAGQRSAARPDTPSSPAPASLVRASEAFRRGAYAEAAAILRRGDAQDERGRRLLAASLFLSGEEQPALDVWEAAGGLTLDLVRVEGARRTRSPVLHRLLGLPEGRTLHRSDLARARRRLDLAPSVAAGRVSYRPVGSELAEVDVAVVERPSLPSPLALAASAGAGLLTGSVTLRASLTGAGEATTLRARWSDAHRSGSLTLAAPAVAGLPGIVTVEMGAVTERHPTGEGSGRWGRARVEDWATGSLRWWTGLGGERWDGRGVAGTVAAGFEIRPSDARSAGLEASVGGLGGRRYWTVRAGAGGSLLEAGPHEVRGRVWLDAVADAAPLALLPGAGTGRVRDRLLRAHPLVTGDVVDGAGRGRVLAGGTLEGVRWWQPGQRAAGLRVGLAAFVDAVRPLRSPASDDLLVDGGLGLRVGHPLLPGELRLDAAVGLLDRATALSAGWSIPLKP